MRADVPREILRIERNFLDFCVRLVLKHVMERTRESCGGSEKLKNETKIKSGVGFFIGDFLVISLF